MQEFCVASTIATLTENEPSKILSREGDDWLPNKAHNLFEPHVLTDTQQQQLDEVLDNFPWTPTEGELNATSKYVHHIDTGNEKPFQQKQFHMSPYVEKKIGEELERLLARGIIKRITFSEWLNRIVPIRKKDDSIRLCLDARELNKRTRKSTYPQVDMNRILNRLDQTAFLSALDLAEAFFQIKLSEDSCNKTAFAIAGFGYFCFDRMPMGCVNSSAALCALIDRVFGLDFESSCFWYVDDFLIASRTFEEHLSLLRRVAERLKEAELTVSRKKSQFCMKKLRFLGMIVSEKGIQVDDTKVEAVVNMKRPETVKQMQSFLGMTGFFRRFIDGYAELAAPLSEMTKGKPTGLVWDDNAKRAFESLKVAMTQAPILANPQYDKPFVIECDSSDWCAGSVLMQYIDGTPHVIEYYSTKYNQAQRQYTTTEKECLSVILSIEKFRPYIDMTHFTVVTDHASLKWLANLRDPTGRLSRWALRLQCFDFEIMHRPGKQHHVPDTLSRPVDLIDTTTFLNTTDEWYVSRYKSAETHPDNYKVIDNVLYRKIPNIVATQEWKICVPAEQRVEVLRQEHDDVSACHPGYHKTLRRVQLKYHWPHMSDFVSKYVRECQNCRANKASNENTRAPMTTYRYGKYPGQNLAMDYIGPYPRSKEGYRFAVVVVDSFTKFVFAQPIRDATAAITIKFLRREIFSQFFVPQIIVSDNGPQFRSESFAQELKKYGIEHWRTAVYHPQANASECANKSIINGMRAYIENKYGHTGWPIHFDEVVCAYNTSPHSATGMTPYFAMFGREMVIDPREYKAVVHANEPIEMSSDRLATIRNEINTQLAKSFETNQKRYNLRAAERSFNVGDHVWIANGKLSSAAQHYSQKLASKKTKAIVIEKIGNSTYRLQSEAGHDLGTHAAAHIFIV